VCVCRWAREASAEVKLQRLPALAKNTYYLVSHTESQNGRRWQGPLWVTQSNPLPKQGRLQQTQKSLKQPCSKF